jgi:hypothetical protein
MVNFFVTHHQDESFDSLVGRFKLRTLRSDSGVKSELFGNSVFRLSVLYPTYINSFISNTKHLLGWDYDFIINNHTIWPYFFCFLSPKEIRQIELKISKGVGVTTGTFGRFGAKKNVVPRYCPICLEQNEASHGEFYWNRLHQIPDIKICITHKCFLEDVKIEKHDGERNDPIFSPIEELCPIRTAKFNSSTIVYDISSRLIGMLKGSIKINFNFRQRVAEQGFSNGKYIKILKLTESFKEFYGDDILKLYSFPSTFITSTIISGTKKSSVLIGYILVDYFLENYSLKKTTHQLKPYWDRHFFGNGPWKCYDPNCRRIIKTPIFKYYEQTKHTVGKFECKCGRWFTKSYLFKDGKIDKVLIKRYKRTRKDRGRKRRVSEDELNRARNLFWDLQGEIQSDQKHSNRKSQNRVWLLKYNPNWLKKQISKLKALKQVKLIESRKARGIKFVKIIKLNYQKLKNENPAYQISKNVLLNNSGFGYDVSKYPEVENFLNQNSETVEEFRIRRLHQIANELLEAGKELTETSLLKRFHSKARKTLLQEAQKLILRGHM